MFKVNEVFENEIFGDVDNTVKSYWKKKVYAYINPFPYVGAIEGDVSDTDSEMPGLENSSNPGSVYCNGSTHSWKRSLACQHTDAAEIAVANFTIYLAAVRGDLVKLDCAPTSSSQNAGSPGRYDYPCRGRWSAAWTAAGSQQISCAHRVRLRFA